MRSNILSKLIFASCVWYSDRAYCGLCVLINDIGRWLPLQLQCSYQGQQGDVSQSVRGNCKTRFRILYTPTVSHELFYHIALSFLSSIAFEGGTWIDICVHHFWFCLLLCFFLGYSSTPEWLEPVLWPRTRLFELMWEHHHGVVLSCQNLRKRNVQCICVVQQYLL